MMVTTKVSLVEIFDAALAHCAPVNALDAYDRHFGPASKDLSNEKRDLADQKKWKTSKARHGRIGNVVQYSVGETVDHSNAEGSSKLAVRIPKHAILTVV